MRRFFITAIAAIAAVTSSTNARAIAAPPPPIHRDSEGRLIVWGEAAVPRLELADFSRPYSRSLRSDPCGMIQVRPTNAYPNIGGSVQVRGGVQAIADLPQLPAAPACRGNQLEPPQASSFRVGDRLYLVGLAPGVRYEVIFPDVPRRAVLRPNACGFYRISNPPARFGVGGQNYALEALPVAAPPLCIDGRLYLPA